MSGGGENWEVGEGTARISELDPESHVDAEHGVTMTLSELHFRERVKPIERS